MLLLLWPFQWPGMVFRSLIGLVGRLRNACDQVQFICFNHDQLLVVSSWNTYMENYRIVYSGESRKFLLKSGKSLTWTFINKYQTKEFFKLIFHSVSGNISLFNLFSRIDIK